MIVIEILKFRLHWKLRLLGIFSCLVPIIGILYYNNTIMKIISGLFTLVGMVGIIDAFTSVIIIEEEKLIYKFMFKVRIIYWKDIRHIKYNIQSEGNNVGVHLLRADEGVVFGKTITISSFYKDYKSILRQVINKSKDDPYIRIDSKVYDLIK